MPKQLEQSCSNILESFLVDVTNTKSFGSRKARPSFINSKGFLMFLTGNASSTIDFSRVVIDEGLVDSLSIKEIGRSSLCTPSPLKSSRQDGICMSLFQERYRGSTHPRQLYRSRPSRVSTGLDMTNAGESSPYYGMDAPQVWSKGLPSQDKSIRRIHGSSGLSILQYTKNQQQRGQCRCSPKG
jgi:hypothetical protein